LKLINGMEAAWMATLEPPSGDSPAYRQLTAAHELYMRQVSGILLERVPLKAGDAIGRWGRQRPCWPSPGLTAQLR
jgi:hypothetical protein